MIEWSEEIRKSAKDFYIGQTKGNGYDSLTKRPGKIITTLSDFIEDEMTVLDVGAGPISLFEKHSKKINVTAVDALADVYIEILHELNLTPDITTYLCNAEELSNDFPPCSFDLVFCNNAIDHFFFPHIAFFQMCSVVKRTGTLFLRVVQDSGKRSRYNEMHQWSIRQGDKDELLLFDNKENQVTDLSRLASFHKLYPESITNSGKIITAIYRTRS